MKFVPVFVVGTVMSLLVGPVTSTSKVVCWANVVVSRPLNAGAAPRFSFGTGVNMLGGGSSPMLTILVSVMTSVVEPGTRAKNVILSAPTKSGTGRNLMRIPIRVRPGKGPPPQTTSPRFPLMLVPREHSRR